MAHHHHLHHNANERLEQANQEYFSNNISEFDKPQNLELARRAAKAMTEQYPFDENSTVVMDFACGVGLISRELAPHAKKIVGVDITKALVDVYNERVSNQGITPDEMRAVCVNLKGEGGELEGLKFDVVVCSASYHHFESIESITKALVFFLKPGGALLVVDIQDSSELQDAGGQSNTVHDHVIPQQFHHMVPHTRGFKQDRIRKVFEDAGLVSVTVKEAMKVRRSESSFSHHDDHEDSKSGSSQVITFFIAKGEKPTT